MSIYTPQERERTEQWMQRFADAYKAAEAAMHAQQSVLAVFDKMMLDSYASIIESLRAEIAEYDARAADAHGE